MNAGTTCREHMGTGGMCLRLPLPYTQFCDWHTADRARFNAWMLGQIPEYRRLTWAEWQAGVRS